MQTFGLSSAADILQKVRRDCGALKMAVTSQDNVRIADALFNFSITAYQLKDWLKEQTSAAYSKSDVESWVHKTPCLLICKDLCTANKHRIIKDWVPLTAEVTASAVDMRAQSPAQQPAQLLHVAPGSRQRYKIMMTDGTKFELTQLANEIVAAWELFFRQHGL